MGNLKKYASVTRGVAQGRTPRKIFIIVPAIYVTLAIVPPVAGLVLVSLSPYWKGNIDFSLLSFDAYRAVLSSPSYVQAITTTLFVTIVSVVVALFCAVTIGLYLLRSRSIVSRALDFVINLPLAMPGIVIGLGILVSYGLGFFDLYGTRTAFVIAYVYLYTIFGLRMVVSGLTRIPDSYENAARIAGCNAVSALGRITLPLLRNSLTSAALLMLVLMSHEFAASMVLRTSSNQVLSTKLYDAFGYGTYPEVAALAVLMVSLSAVLTVLILAVRGGKNIEL